MVRSILKKKKQTQNHMRKVHSVEYIEPQTVDLKVKINSSIILKPFGEK